MIITRLPARPERSILAECLRYLALRHITHWRMNSGMAMLPGAGGKAMPVRFGAKGMADILAVLPGGRFWAIECKRVGKQPTADQEAFCRAVEAAGGTYTVAYGVGEVERVLANAERARGIVPATFLREARASVALDRDPDVRTLCGDDVTPK